MAKFDIEQGIFPVEVNITEGGSGRKKCAGTSEMNTV